MEIIVLDKYIEIKDIYIEELDESEINLIYYALLKNGKFCLIEINNNLMIEKIIEQFKDGIKYYTYDEKLNELCVLPKTSIEIIFELWYLYLMAGIIIIINLYLIVNVFVTIVNKFNLNNEKNNINEKSNEFEMI